MPAIHTSDLEPLPHQIQAVYGEMLPRRPLEDGLREEPLKRRGQELWAETARIASSVDADICDPDDVEELPDAELGDLEEELVDQASAARTIADLRTEIETRWDKDHRPPRPTGRHAGGSTRQCRSIPTMIERGTANADGPKRAELRGQSSIIFISHSAKDLDAVGEVIHGLEQAGYRTWHFGQDVLPGTSYLVQISGALARCDAVVLVVSANSIDSDQVSREVVGAFERGKPLFPILLDMTPSRLKERQPEWRHALGGTAMMCAGSRTIGDCVTQVVEGLRARGLHPGAEGEQPSTQHTEVVAPGKSLPKNLQDKILSSRTSLEGERKQVTVLFADIAGFASISENLDPEDLRDFVSQCLAIMVEQVHLYEGTVTQFLGAGIMALFGAPIVHEDDPQRALHAALGMRERLREHAEKVRQEGIEFDVRIGLNTGLVVVGHIGDDLSMGYTAVGDTVNLASLLQKAAPTGGVLISHDTYRLVRGIFEVAQQQPIQVKDKAKPQQSYLVLRAKPRAFRLGTRGVEGIETRMVGRDAELLTLQSVFRDAMEDRATRVVTIVGEAGVGKSRLLYEFEKWVELLPDEVRRFEGWATSGTREASFGAIRRMLARRFEILESDSAATVRDKIRAGMAVALDADRADLSGQLIGFDLPLSDALQGALQTPLFREQALAGLTDYFRAVAQEPTVIFLEDMHWADDSSLDLVDHLAGALPEARLLLVCLARPVLFERRPGWGEGLETHVRLDLEALSRRESRTLVADILQRVEEIPAQLRDLVVEGAEGNPFYVEELIKMLIDDGVISKGEGRWQVELARLADVHVPPTLAGVLQARLDGLPAEERALLQRASVVGRLFWDRAVAELVTDEDRPLDTDDLATLLEAARRRELVFRREHSAFADAEEYTFKHALMRDVTYETVLLRLRRVYHKQVAAWLEASVGERLGEYLGLIAAHYNMAGETEKAIAFLAQAGERAFRLCAFQEAIVHFSQGLELLQGLPDSAERTEQELGLQLPLAIAMMNLKGYGDPQVWQAFTCAHELCDRIGDTPQIAVALHGLGAFYCARGENKSAIDLAERILRIARQASDSTTLLLVGHHGQTANLTLVGDLDRALDHAQRVLELYDPQQHRTLIHTLGIDLKTVTMSWASVALWLRGFPDQARQMSHEALVHGRELSHPPTLSFALKFASVLFHNCRDGQGFRELTDEWLALSTEYGISMWAQIATVMQGRSLCEQGLTIEGLAKMREGVDALRAGGTGAFRTYLLAMLAEGYRMAGHPEEGLAALEEGLALVEKSGERYYEAELHRLKGELRLAQGADATEGERDFQQAIAVARDLNARSLELRAVMSLSSLRQKQGRREEAAQMLAETYGWFTEGLDTGDLQEAKALLRDLSA